ncbi:GAF domain-containing protein [Halomicroarcula sp. F13]|uniref:histidine kinase n=1 Tax=Haloarcula rubra TaxID=2487747 RepID=A0AAW4PWS6_9EURY|nr:GAF domain-containing protein [Halomicroarcula rubra]MBX0325622.1 GAF domain-containing protein [Halomicroarcula rubra]
MSQTTSRRSTLAVLTLPPALFIGSYLTQWLFLRDGPVTPLAVVEALVFIGALGVPLYLAVRLREASFSPAAFRTIIGTTLGTTVLLTGIVALYHAELRIEGHLLPFAEIVEAVLFGAAVGMAVGSVGGLFRARVIRRENQLRAERETLASRSSLLSTLTQNIPAGILAEDGDRQLLFTNQAFCETFDIDAEPADLVGRDCAAAAEGVKDQFVDAEQFIERTNEAVSAAASIHREEFDLVDGRTLERRSTPVELGADDTGYLWVYRDITEQKQYEHRLGALHETTRELMAAETPEDIATVASEAASEILQLPLNGIHLYDETVEGLVPVAWSDETADVVGEPPVFTPDDSVAWQIYETQEVTVHDDIRGADNVSNPQTPIRTEIHLPLGEHGVFLIGSTTAGAFDQTDITLAKVLATNLEAALARAEREQTLRKRETQLSRERDRFATLFEAIPDPAVTVSLNDGKPITQAVNEAFEEVFGYPTEETIGTSLNDLIVPPEFADEAARIDERAVADEQIIREVRRQTADGEIRDFLFRNVPIDSDHNDAYGIYTDITDRKRRERTLEALNDVTRDQIQASSPEQICDLAVTAARDTLDRPFSAVHLVDDAERELRPMSMTADVTDYFQEGDLTYTESDTVVWECFDTGEPRVIDDVTDVADSRLPTPDTPVRSALILPLGAHGVFIISSLDSHAFDDDEIQLAELLAATTTVALDRKTHERTLAQLHDATRKLMTVSDEQTIADLTLEAARDILGFSLVSVRYHDTERDVLVPVAVTEEGHEQLGNPTVFDREESLAWEPLETGAPRLIKDVTDCDASVNAGSGVRSLMILPIGTHGTLNIAATKPAAFDDADVSLAQILAANVKTALDRAADERELRQRERELQRQNDRLEEFAGVLSHDLRNPLSIANGQLELLDVPEENDHVAAIRRAHDRMAALIDDVLTLARQGQSVVETTPVSIQQVATEAWQQVQTDTATLDVDADVQVDADASRLQQLFENLFRNAIDHGGPDVTIRVKPCADDTGFLVADDGPGIAPADRDEIFEHGYSTVTEGTGFGLAIVQQIVGAHGWTIDLTESVDGGAQFEINTGRDVSDHDS